MAQGKGIKSQRDVSTIDVIPRGDVGAKLRVEK